MESSPVYEKFRTLVDQALNKFYAMIENDPTLFNEERLAKFIFRLFGNEESPEEIAQSVLNKTFLERFMKTREIRKFFLSWERFLNANTNKETNSRFNLTVGSETPGVQKNHVNVEVVSDTKKQTELLNQHLSTLNPDLEVPFVAVKLYSANPNETKEFLDGILQMVTPMLESLPLPFLPELNVVAGDNHVIVQATANKSIEVSFAMVVLGHLIAELPEYDLELRLSLQLGTNFGYLIQNHTDNTVFDLLNGLKLSLEFKNNLAGFLDEFIGLLIEKGKTNEIKQFRMLSLVLGSLSLNTDLNVKLGANELALMGNLPRVNIFDKEGVLSAAPIGEVKQMREDEMGQMILPNLNSLEGRADVFVSCPFFTLHVNVDSSGALDLANSTIDLFSS